MTDVEMADATEGDEFYLSRVIDAHKADVKCLTSTSAGVIISGGRDETVKFWSKRGGEFSETLAFPQPKGLAVNSIGYYESPDGWRVFVGRKDGSIAVYGSGSPEPLTVLTQHSSNVCCLYVDEKNHILLSGSWDNNVIVWPIKELGAPEFPALLLNGHKLSVWALAAIEASPGYYLSGSADKTIKLWRDDNEVRTFTGHTDVVRALLVLSPERFLSAANDATIRLWHTETGVCLGKFASVQDEFIFDLALVDSQLVSCSEGGYVEIWNQSTRDGQLSLSHGQLIQSPALTLWAVRGLQNGDIACAASDGRIYVFTQEKNRKASAEVAAAYEDAVAVKVAKELERKERQANETVVIKVSLDDGAPNMELRYKKGTDPTLAAEKFIQDYNLPASYLNEITEYIKAHVPEAAAAALKQHKVQPTQRVMVDGEEYDFAFDVTVDDGRKLRLPYNLSEDPDVAAQRFVEKHNLPISFLAKVSGLLRSQTGATTTGKSAQFYDPFTGTGRYVPGQPDTLSSNGGADPLTGEGRYIPGQARGDFTAASAGDPFTSSGRYKPGSASGDVIPNACLPQDKKRPRGELVPMASYYRFGVEQLSAKALAKLVEVNNKQTALKLNEEQLAAIQRLMSGSGGSSDCDLIATALETGLQWEIGDLVPILDVFRVALLDETLNSYFCDMKLRGENTQQRLSALLLSEPPDAIGILVCRSMTNAFVHKCGREMLSHDFQTLFTIVANQLGSSKAALQLAAASALANWSLLLLNRSEKVAELGPREDAIRAIIKVCEEKYSSFTSFGSLNEAAMIRLLQAIVTLMWGDATVIALAKSRNMLSIVNRMKDAVVDERGKNVARDIAEMIYAI
ncbi:PUL domain protein [Ancylostoma caninum]|uniref:PUL domain protein n=1 Tax=Ancylostoma caninum TaxID=29170 RepID=A0A368G8K6_ANCCA|nr:PUL domain protein [Ancylostoma caninum]